MAALQKFNFLNSYSEPNRPWPRLLGCFSALGWEPHLKMTSNLANWHRTQTQNSSYSHGIKQSTSCRYAGTKGRLSAQLTTEAHINAINQTIIKAWCTKLNLSCTTTLAFFAVIIHAFTSSCKCLLDIFKEIFMNNSCVILAGTSN